MTLTGAAESGHQRTETLGRKCIPQFSQNKIAVRAMQDALGNFHHRLRVVRSCWSHKDRSHERMEHAAGRRHSFAQTVLVPLRYKQNKFGSLCTGEDTANNSNYGKESEYARTRTRERINIGRS